MTKDSSPYSHKINVDRIPGRDTPLQLEPGEAIRAAIARAYDLDGLVSLTANLILKPYRKAGVRVTGEIHARPRQICGVSLEPFETDLVVDVDRTFEPHSSRPRRQRDINEDGEIEFDLDSLDPPDVVTDGVLDLGAVLCEELSLSLDPFPRKSGAQLAAREDKTEDQVPAEEKPSPFAALLDLKDKSGDDH